MRQVQGCVGSFAFPSQSCTLSVVSHAFILHRACQCRFGSATSFADELNGACQGVCAIFHSKRPLDNFDAIDVVQSNLAQIDVATQAAYQWNAIKEYLDIQSSQSVQRDPCSKRQIL